MESKTEFPDGDISNRNYDMARGRFEEVIVTARRVEEKPELTIPNPQPLTARAAVSVLFEIK